MGHFVNCTCKAFSEKARVVQPSYLGSREIWLVVQAKHAQQIMFSSDQVKQFCQHASIRNTRVWPAIYQWTGTKRSVTLDDTRGLWNQTSITVTAGLQVVGSPQHNEVISVEFTGGQCSGSTPKFYSVLTGTDSEHVKGHAFVKHTMAQLRMDASPRPTKQMQLFCEECQSRLKHSRGSGTICQHIHSVHDGSFLPALR